MLTHIIVGGVCLFIGWNVPGPKWSARAWESITNWIGKGDK